LRLFVLVLHVLRLRLALALVLGASTRAIA